jgi:uncharacterized protein YceH (UPF0502 family)
MAREVLEVTTTELVMLAELLLRGPQTVGELRGRATRMHPIESLEEAQATLDGLMGRPEPMVKELPPVYSKDEFVWDKTDLLVAAPADAQPASGRP